MLQNIKDVHPDELPAICRSIRTFLVKNIADSGGHLASNLGVVELTVALHRVLDTAIDRLIFDVGHQCYVHKLLTGRRDGFDDFRSLGSMAGFPKPTESSHDPFVAGHASTSVSVALGMARARTLLKKEHRVVAVLGDGALTGGLAYEGLNDAGASGEPMVVILNDNKMSIAPNVGAVSKHLSRLRTQPQYFQTKKWVHKVLAPMPGGRFIDRVITIGKDAARNVFIPGSFFTHMGFFYLGPANGHDIAEIEKLLKVAFALNAPVIIHLITKKGKGYHHAESNPRAYHGVSKFHVESGEAQTLSARSYSDVFGEELVCIAERDKSVVAVTAAMRDGTGLTPFAKRFPGKFFDVGIAEGHAVTMAGGMAKQGLRPFVPLYSTFMQRAYDNLMHDIALQNLPVVFLADRAGLVGEDGETHHGTLDPLFVASLPNFTLWEPCSFRELREMLQNPPTGPLVIRYPRGEEAIADEPFKPVHVLREGSDATIVTHGRMTAVALEAADSLTPYKIRVVCVSSLKPFPTIETQGRVFLLEDNAPFLPQHLDGIPLNVGDVFVPHGSVSSLLTHCGLDAKSVGERILHEIAS